MDGCEQNRFYFRPDAKLLTKKDFSKVFDHATFRFSNHHFLGLVTVNESGQNRLGIVISKKNVRLANKRNAYKRTIRESFRLIRHDLPCVDVVILARKQFQQLERTKLSELLEVMWKKLIKHYKNSSSD